MKRIIITLLLCIITLPSFANKEYLSFYIRSNHDVLMCSGNKSDYSELKDRNGKKIKSASVTYILNYFAKRGWVYVGFADGVYIMEREFQIQTREAE